MTTVEDLVGRILRRMSMYSGIDTQTYAQDRIVEILQEKFDYYFTELFWPEYTTYGEQFTLDGTLGVVTADITDRIKRFVDVKHIWYENEEKPLPSVTTNVNPAQIRQRSYGPNNTPKIFQLYPNTLTGNVRVTYRTKPEALELDTDVLLDESMLINAVCADYLEDDGTNPAAVEKFMKAEARRFDQLRKALMGDVSLDRYTRTTQTEWI